MSQHQFPRMNEGRLRRFHDHHDDTGKKDEGKVSCVIILLLVIYEDHEADPRMIDPFMDVMEANMSDFLLLLFS